jgi:hypothetical protein
MDPYLESPIIWPDVHHEFTSDLRAALQSNVRPHYAVRVQLRIYTSDVDDPAREALVLSPTNKIRGSRGRASFMAKRHEIMNSEVHWIEIDLLRGGVPSVTAPPLRPCDYRVLVSRADQRTRTRFWPISVRHPLPVIGIPLRGKDPEVPLDLGAVFRTVYDRAGYDITVDYRKDPQPPLQGDDAKWAREVLCGRRE